MFVEKVAFFHFSVSFDSNFFFFFFCAPFIKKKKVRKVPPFFSYVDRRDRTRTRTGRS